MRLKLIAMTVLLGMSLLPARVDAAAPVTIRHAPYDKGCVASFEPGVAVGCVAPSAPAKYGRVSGGSHPTICLSGVLGPQVCDGAVAGMAVVKLRRSQFRFTPRVTVSAQALARVPAVDNYKSTRPRLCVLVLKGTPLRSVWGNCVPLLATGRTTIALREDRTLAKDQQYFIGAAVYGHGVAKVDRIAYELVQS